MSRLIQRRLMISPTRLFSTTAMRSVFAPGPAPPRLPPKEQEEFERLQRTSTGAFSTPTTRPSISVNQSSSASPHETPQINQSPAYKAEKTVVGTDPVSEADVKPAAVDARIQASGKGEELHPDVRRGAKPEFEGDVNPKTGEVGGPKNEPLRWGSTGERGDWSYNGRVTDF